MHQDQAKSDFDSVLEPIILLRSFYFSSWQVRMKEIPAIIYRYIYIHEETCNFHSDSTHSAVQIMMEKQNFRSHIGTFWRTRCFFTGPKRINASSARVRKMRRWTIQNFRLWQDWLFRRLSSSKAPCDREWVPHTRPTYFSTRRVSFRCPSHPIKILIVPRSVTNYCLQQEHCQMTSLGSKGIRFQSKSKKKSGGVSSFDSDFRSKGQIQWKDYINIIVSFSLNA